METENQIYEISEERNILKKNYVKALWNITSMKSEYQGTELVENLLAAIARINTLEDEVKELKGIR